MPTLSGIEDRVKSRVGLAFLVGFAVGRLGDLGAPSSPSPSTPSR